MRLAEDLVRHTDHWVLTAMDARRLAAVRIGLCCLLALRLALVDYEPVAGRTPVFQPHFYMQLFERMPSPDTATALKVCGIVAALAAAAGLALRATLPMAFVCALILNGMRNSDGRVIVGDALLMLCLLLLIASASAAGEAWTVRGPVRRVLRRIGGAPPRMRATAIRPARRGARYGWPIRAAMIAVALVYFLAGFQKWRYSGLPWVTSDNLRWILYGQAHPDDVALFIANRPLLSHFFAAGALGLETCFPLVLFISRLRWLFIPAAAAMHIGIWLALRLDYSAQWLTMVIVFVNWPVVVAWFRRRISPAPTLREAPG